MKIFYSAVFDNIGKSSDTSKLRELANAGHEVLAYNYRLRAFHFDKNEVVSNRRDDEIIKICNEWKPDLAIFAKCNGVHIRVFEEIKKVTTVCYWFADPYMTYNHPEFLLKTSVADFVTCDKKNVFDKAITLNPNTFITPDGYDSTIEKPWDVAKKYDVSFIGNLYGDRKEKISKIKNDVSIITNVYGDQHAKAVSESKINLNFCTSSGPSDRVFKVLGAGGFLITDSWLDFDEYFEAGKHLVVFEDFEDLNKKIEYYLNNDAEREKIALEGHKKVQEYTRKQWAKKTIDSFLSFKSNSSSA